MTHDLSTQEAAEKLGVTERTIRNWIDQGTINAYKLNPNTKSVYRIPAIEVDKVLRTRKHARQNADVAGH